MTQSHPVKAALWMMGAVVSFTSMAVAGREASHELDTFELMTYRSLIGIVIVLVISSLAGTHRQIRVNRMRLHFVRNAFHFAGQNLWFYALTVATLPQVFAFEFSVPLWISLTAPFFLAEKLTRARLAAAVVGFVGILLVARPDMAGLNLGIIAAAVAAIGFTGSGLATKLLTRTESTTSILFWLTIMQAGFGIVCAGYDLDIALPSVSTLPWVVLIGIAGLLAHFCITSALQIAPAIIVFPMDFVRLPLAATIGIMIYAEPLEWIVFAGAAVILGANFVNILAEQKSRKPARG